jgi:hypothetical protein
MLKNPSITFTHNFPLHFLEFFCFETKNFLETPRTSGYFILKLSPSHETSRHILPARTFPAPPRSHNNLLAMTLHRTSLIQSLINLRNLDHKPPIIFHDYFPANGQCLSLLKKSPMFVLYLSEFDHLSHHNTYFFNKIYPMCNPHVML